MNRIFLMGYMGSGKSTVGKKLAKKLGFAFVDLDKHIETKYEKSVNQLFEEEGETTFREIEREMLVTCLEMKETVISLGGGTPCYFDNLQQIQNHGISVYLKMTAAMLVSRLKNAKSIRPLLQGMNEPEMFEFVQQQLGEREKYYLRANLIYNGSNVNVEELKQNLLNLK